jgi:hypothetical protein
MQASGLPRDSTDAAARHTASAAYRAQVRHIRLKFGTSAKCDTSSVAHCTQVRHTISNCRPLDAQLQQRRSRYLSSLPRNPF